MTLIYRVPYTADGLSLSNADVKLSNPLRGVPHDRLMADVEIFAQERGLTHLLPELKKGALVAQDPSCMYAVVPKNFHG